jgi:hypothetical protein
MGRSRVSIWDWSWLLAWGILSSVWCVTAAGRLGATWDEPVDVANALDFWRTGSHQKLLRLGAMPLPMDVGALPLYLWERCHGVTIDIRHGDVTTALWCARLGTLLFWWLLLYYGWRMGSFLAGPWAGRLAVALLASEPNLLAHACLATKDIAITGCLLALIYHFRIGREAGWWRRVGVPGFWFALALLSKGSALVFGPLCMLAVEIERLLREPSGRRQQASDYRGQRAEPGADAIHDPLPFSLSPLLAWWRLLQPWRRDVVQAGLIGLALTIVYCGSDWRAEPSFVAWTHQLPDSLPARGMVWFAEHLQIFRNGPEALVKQVTHNLRGHGAFILGRIYPRSIWYYFPVALSIKLTVPLLLLPCLLALLRPRALANAACAAAGMLLLYSVRCNVQIGIRLLLPLVALAIVGLAAALVRAYQDSGRPWQRAVLSCGAVGAVSWAAAASVLVWPHALCYTNELWGGTAQGYLRLSDSNYDWGQGLKELADWQRQHGNQTLDVWYFGTDPIIETLPMRDVHLERALGSPEEALAPLQGHHLAVSMTLVYGSYAPSEPMTRISAYLRNQRPVDRTQTFLIYDFTRARQFASMDDGNRK